MESQLKFSFDDEVVSKFCYDSDSKLIILHFSGYSDLEANERILENKCVFTIKNWNTAKGIVHGEAKHYNLNDCINVFSMILSMEMLDGWLSIEVNTFDNKYINYLFFKPEITFTHEQKI
jgi:hypothetical protein